MENERKFTYEDVRKILHQEDLPDMDTEEAYDILENAYENGVVFDDPNWGPTVPGWIYRLNDDERFCVLTGMIALNGIKPLPGIKEHTCNILEKMLKKGVNRTCDPYPEPYPYEIRRALNTAIKVIKEERED